MSASVCPSFLERTLKTHQHCPPPAAVSCLWSGVYVAFWGTSRCKTLDVTIETMKMLQMVDCDSPSESLYDVLPSTSHVWLGWHCVGLCPFHGVSKLLKLRVLWTVLSWEITIYTVSKQKWNNLGLASIQTINILKEISSVCWDVGKYQEDLIKKM